MNYLLRGLFLVGLIWITQACEQASEPEKERFSGAAKSLNQWYAARSYPYNHIQTKRYQEAHQDRKKRIQVRGNNQAAWHPLGPMNIAGRTLDIAFHPDDPDIMFAGSASGGLWKTTTAGISSMVDGELQLAWKQVPIDWPVLSIASIAIDSEDPNIMYLGTGEVYNDQKAMPGIYNRYTRGIYGIGILKSTDGGESWDLSLDWSKSDLTGVQDIVINPLNHNTIYACTSEGLYVSYDQGGSWQILHDIEMAVDMEISAADTSVLFVTHGSYRNEDYSGIYRSLDAGKTWAVMDNGLPTGFSGKAMIRAAVNDPSLIYAYVSEYSRGIGLYKTQDSGDNWEMVSNRNITMWQGWYAGDLAVQPEDPNTVVIVGIDVHRSDDGGSTVGHYSSWEAWNKGKIRILEAEGLFNYVHADIHRVYYHPTKRGHLVFATDGGMFYSKDNGEKFEGRNGGMQTSQFYANFSNSSQDPFFAIGGLQDNATTIYDGTIEWLRVIGGDGMSTAIDPLDDQIVYGSIQSGSIHRSDNRGLSFKSIKPDDLWQDQVSFNVPYEIAPSEPSIIYLGGERIHMSEDRGETWRVLSDGPVDGGNTIISVEVAPADPTLLYVSTAPGEGGGPKVLKSNGGKNWTVMEGLPDRLAMDVAIHPINTNIVYVGFSGFNTRHIYKTTNAGMDWEAIDDGLPDIPVNTLLIDPYQPRHVYVGTDLGIYVSEDEGVSWSVYEDGLPNAVMVMDLSISHANRKLRAATHGNGAWEGNLLSNPVSTSQEVVASGQLFQNFPNPVVSETTFKWDLDSRARISMELFTMDGQLVRSLDQSTYPAGLQIKTVDLGDLPSGMYVYRLSVVETNGKRWNLSKRLVKQ